MADARIADTEEWRPVLGHEGRYEVSSTGRVRSIDREFKDRRGRLQRVKGRVLKPTTNSTGYQVVSLANSGEIDRRLVHLIVADAFIGMRNPGFEVCHNNGDNRDNRIENLRIDTVSENRLDTVRHGNNKNANKTRCINGHAYTPENTYYNPANGHRSCRTCRANRLALWRSKNRK